MQVATCTCTCGNIRIRGQLLPQGVYPNIVPTERERLRSCRSLYSIQTQSIELQDPRKVQARLMSHACADMSCTCSTAFRFFFGRGYSYFGRLPDNTQNQLQNQQQNQLQNQQQNQQQQALRAKKPNTVSPAPLGNTPNSTAADSNINNNNNKLPQKNGNPTGASNLPNIFMPLISPQRAKPSSSPSQQNQSFQNSVTTPKSINDQDQNSSPMMNTANVVGSGGFSLNLDDNSNTSNNNNNNNGLKNNNNDELLFNNNEDTDFDLMFSNNVDPVVGSYKMHMGLPADGALGNISFTDFQPKSYYA